jgi:hypothetical protein
MQNNQDNLDRRVWQYLEAGQWDNAYVTATYVVRQNPTAIQNVMLANRIRQLAEIEDALRLKDKLSLEHTTRLEEIAGSDTRMAALPSFQNLASEVKRRLAEAETAPIQAEVAVTSRELFESKKLARLRSGNLIFARLKKANKGGIFATSLLAALVVFGGNFGAYQYLKNQPVNVSGTLTEWSGIYTWSKPVDTLLLGDSTCGYNLSTGPFADRLGGRAVNLGNFATTSFMMDAWMLSAYVQRFGPPRNVVLLRSSPRGYALPHLTQYMAELPLGWDFWRKFGIAPDWSKGDVFRLFVDKYFVLYSDSDILRKRLVEPMSLFKHKVGTVYPSNEYFNGTRVPGENLDIKNRQPDYYFGAFTVSTDTAIALGYMSDLARSLHFQLYILFPPEWDEAIAAGLRSDLLAAQTRYLAQFADPTYVHVINDNSLIFGKNQLQNPSHLRPGPDRIYTETYVSAIVGIQNHLTESSAQILDLTSSVLDKKDYAATEKPVLTLSVSNKGNSKVGGSASCLVKLAGEPDSAWVVRAPSVPFEIEPKGSSQLKLQVNVGNFGKPGLYDVVVLLRQDAGQLSSEIRIEIRQAITVH